MGAIKLYRHIQRARDEWSQIHTNAILYCEQCVFRLDECERNIHMIFSSTSSTPIFIILDIPSISPLRWRTSPGYGFQPTSRGYVRSSPMAYPAVRTPCAQTPATSTARDAAYLLRILRPYTDFTRSSPLRRAPERFACFGTAAWCGGP